MFKFLHTADLHLDSRLDGLSRYEGAPVERIRDACRRALENLVDLALDERVELVLIAGDVYDGDWQDYNTGLYFAAQMARLREAGIPVYLIACNHDAANKMTRMLRLPDNVTALATDRPETRRLDGLGVAIHGQGFATGAVTDDLSRHYPPAIPGCFNIGLLHSCVEGAEGHDRYAPCTLSGLVAKGYDYWALGHIHKRAILRTDPHVVYPGNIQGRHIRETGPKGCMLGTVIDNLLAGLEFRRLDVVRFEPCLVQDPPCGDEEGVYDLAAGKIGALLAEEDPARLLVVRVILQGQTPLHARLRSDPGRCAAAIRARALQFGEDRVWVEKVEIRTSPCVDEPGQGPIEELLEVLAELRSDPERLRQEGELLGDLRDKLPDEFRLRPDAPRFDDPAWLGAILDEVEALLRDRLTPLGAR